MCSVPPPSRDSTWSRWQPAPWALPRSQAGQFWQATRQGKARGVLPEYAAPTGMGCWGWSADFCSVMCRMVQSSTNTVQQVLRPFSRVLQEEGVWGGGDGLGAVCGGTQPDQQQCVPKNACLAIQGM